MTLQKTVYSYFEWHSGQIYRPVYKSYRLNERMYGALEGKSKVRMSVLFPIQFGAVEWIASQCHAVL